MKCLLLLGGLLLGDYTKGELVLAQQNSLGVVGTWTNCRLESSASVLTANVCPVITFRSDGTGQVKMGAKQQGVFTWQQAGSRLVLHNKATRTPIFDSGTYVVSRRIKLPADGALVLTNKLGLHYILFSGGDTLHP
jgi:hypothetical protein